MTVYAPTTELELAELISANDVQFEVRGRGSKSSLGRHAPIDDILSMAKFTGVINYEPEELVLEAGAATLIGVVLAYFLMLAQQAIYLFKARQLLSTDDGALDQSTISRIVWLRGLHIILVVCWFTFLTSFVSGFFGAKLSALIANSAAIVFLGAILAIGVLGLARADALVRTPKELMTNLVASGQKRYARSALNDGDMDRLAAKLQHALVHGHVFLDSTLSLPILAAKMRTNTNDLSQLINARLGQNFYQLINAARIKHAIALMKSGNYNGTLLDLGFESGFNSKSVFNAAFKRETGLTPSQWKAAAPIGQDF